MTNHVDVKNSMLQTIQAAVMNKSTLAHLTVPNMTESNNPDSQMTVSNLAVADIIFSNMTVSNLTVIGQYRPMFGRVYVQVQVHLIVRKRHMAFTAVHGGRLHEGEFQTHVYAHVCICILRWEVAPIHAGGCSILLGNLRSTYVLL